MVVMVSGMDAEVVVAWSHSVLETGSVAQKVADTITSPKMLHVYAVGLAALGLLSLRILRSHLLMSIRQHTAWDHLQWRVRRAQDLSQPRLVDLDLEVLADNNMVDPQANTPFHRALALLQTPTRQWERAMGKVSRADRLTAGLQKPPLRLRAMGLL